MIEQYKLMDKLIFEEVNLERAKANPDQEKIKNLIERNIANLKALWKLQPSYIGAWKMVAVLPKSEKVYAGTIKRLR